MSKRTLVMVELTPTQRRTLAPLLEEVAKGNANLQDVCVVAQVYMDGIVATVVRDAEVHALRKAWKARDNAPAATARERMEQQ